jgi:hypothetical protein
MESLLILGLAFFFLGLLLSFNRRFQEWTADSSFGKWKGAGLDRQARMRLAKFIYGPGLMLLGGILLYFYVPWLK